MKPGTPYFYALDGVRFVAALSVCLFHLGFYSWASEGSTTSRMFADAGTFPALTPWTWAGWMGVEVFFVLSGFVIANSANGASPIGFLKSRAVRLLPAAWICATITLLAVLAVAGSPLREVAPSYVRAIVLSPVGPWIDGAYWSLGVEVVFYAVIFALLLVRRFRFLPRLAWALLAWSAGFLVLSTLRMTGLLGDNRLLDALSPYSDSLLQRHGVFFAAGVWLWLASNRRMTPARWAGLAAAVAFGALEVWLRAAGLKLYEAPAAQGQSTVGPLVAWAAVMAFFFAATRWPKLFTPASTAVRNGLKSLGRMTYPLYLLQNVVGAGVVRELLTHGVAPYLALSATLACLLALSLVVATGPEVALRRALLRLFERVEPLLQKGGLALRGEPI